MTSRILIALAGLMGVGGVILAAVAAHIAPGFETTLWASADKLRGNMDAAE